ncbi:MAG: hypothetical protein NTV34_02845, partial [Proteobacteria bacterium]|nr:hypothetical protein [Pseudomonadota bacterium]
MGSSTISRLFLPAMVCLFGVGITQAWYMKTASKVQNQGNIGAPLAILTSKNNVIERRPTTRIIWESLGQGEQLFGGEAVRTNSKSSGKITFLNSGMTIGIEPDSLVIIEESNGKLQLNLVNGGVFVKNESSSNSPKSKLDQPTLKAGNKQIALDGGKSSEMNLSVSDEGSANIQVSKGNVQIAGESGKLETIAEGKSSSLTTATNGPLTIEVSGPRSGASIPITGSSDRMNLSWSKVPEGSMIYFESGPSRTSLARATNGTPGQTLKISAPITPGEFFWRIVAVKNDKIVASGPITFNQGIVLESPKLLSNYKGEKIIVRQASISPEIRLSWTRPQGTDEITVYVAKDKDFKNPVASKAFPSEAEWNLAIAEPGSYYWKVTGHWPGIDKLLHSEIGSFELSRQKEIPPPNLTSPLEGTTFTKAMVDTNGIILSWGEQEGIDSYLLTIELEKQGRYQTLLSKTLQNRQFRISNVPSGLYRWNVVAKSGDAQSKASESKKFKVIDLIRLTFKFPDATGSPILFESSSSPITFVLNTVPPDTTRVRYRWSTSAETLKSAPWQSAQSGKPLSFTVPKEGAYTFEAESLNSGDKQTGASDVIEFYAKAPDLLPAPELLTGTQKLTTGESGDVLLKWNPIKGAAKYIV